MEKYFAYGANVNEKVMKTRCSSAETITTGILKDYQIAFVIYSDRWGGGASGILPKTGRQVEGVIYRLSLADLEELDKIEGVQKNHYYRDKGKIHSKEGRIIEAWVYFPVNTDQEEYPSVKYLRTIIEGAQHHQLSERYIKELESLLPEK